MVNRIKFLKSTLGFWAVNLSSSPTILTRMSHREGTNTKYPNNLITYSHSLSLYKIIRRVHKIKKRISLKCLKKRKNLMILSLT